MRRQILSFVVALLSTGAVRAASPAPPGLPPIEDYGKLPAMNFVKLSPSGQRYAFDTVLSGKQYLVVATTANQLLVSQPVETMKVRDLARAGDDHVLMSASSTAHLGVDFTVDQYELANVLVFDVAHHKGFSVFITPDQTRVAKAVFGTYGTAQINGRWYGFFGGFSYDRETGTFPSGRLQQDLYKVDLDTGRLESAAIGQDGVRGWLVGADGQLAGRLVADERNGTWRLCAAVWGCNDLARGSAPIGGVRIEGFGHTTADILLRSPGPDHDVLQEVTLTDGRVKAAYDADEIGAPLFDPNSRLWIGKTGKAEDSKSARFFAPEQQDKLRRTLAAFPKSIVCLVSYSADFNRMIVFTEGAGDSGTYWIIDLAKRSADWLGSPYPMIAADGVGPVRWVDYKAADGLAMRGVLTLPPGRAATGLPLVVLPHGGPEAHDRLRFDSWAQAIASRGYAVWQPNFRGSSGAGNAFRDAGYGQWGRKMQTDISDGVSELARLGVVDPIAPASSAGAMAATPRWPG